MGESAPARAPIRLEAFAPARAGGLTARALALPRPVLFLAALIALWGLGIAFHAVSALRTNAHLRAGLAALATPDYPAAETELRVAIREEPDNFATHLHLGEALLFQRKFPEAKRELERARELHPRDRRAEERLVLLELMKSQPAPPAPRPPK